MRTTGYYPGSRLAKTCAGEFADFFHCKSTGLILTKPVPNETPGWTCTKPVLSHQFDQLVKK